MRSVAVSGGFDPLHIGHLSMFDEAKTLGDYLIVILNNDNWLRKKKGYVFMPQEQRAAILKALKCVDHVIITSHDKDCADSSVCKELSLIGVDVFANGGDRKEDNVPEVGLCRRMGIEVAFNVGGVKVESSSQLVEKAINSMLHYDSLGLAEARPWGSYQVHRHEPTWALKTLDIKPNEETSLQSHTRRAESWMLVKGIAFAHYEGRGVVPLDMFKVFHVRIGAQHRLRGGPGGATIVEVIRGDYDEKDITRYEDKYGRV